MTDSTTYCIYRIVNFRDGKVYVGLTRHPQRRKREHFKSLRRHNHDNSHLQRAYDKYGEGAFFFEFLEKDIPEADAYDREKYWIKHFDAFTKGYNKTQGGEGKPDAGVKCTWNGIEYNSIAAAARAIGIDPSTMKARLVKGYGIIYLTNPRFSAKIKSSKRNGKAQWQATSLTHFQRFSQTKMPPAKCLKTCAGLTARFAPTVAISARIN